MKHLTRSALSERRQIHFYHVPLGTIVILCSPGMNRMILFNKPGTVEIWSLKDDRADPKDEPT